MSTNHTALAHTTCITGHDTGDVHDLDLQLTELEAEPASEIKSGNAIDAAETSFDLLVQGPSPLTVDGAEIGHGLPARPIALVELRALLLHPATGYAARDAVWAELVHRARHDGPAWVVGCLGVALPGLKAALARTVSRHSQDPHRVDEAAAAMASAFYEGLLNIDTDRKAIGPRLLLRARKAAHRACARHSEQMPVKPMTLAQTDRTPVTHRATGHVDLLLAQAVRDGVISGLDASIIGTTRFEDVDAYQVADQLGLSYEALMKRRRRAELRLATAIREGDLHEINGLMSNPGC